MSNQISPKFVAGVYLTTINVEYSSDVFGGWEGVGVGVAGVGVWDNADTWGVGVLCHIHIFRKVR